MLVMEKFEYRVVEFNKITSKTIERDLNRLGVEGWEVTSSTSSSPRLVVAGIWTIIVVLKRKIIE